MESRPIKDDKSMLRVTRGFWEAVCARMRKETASVTIFCETSEETGVVEEEGVKMLRRRIIIDGPSKLKSSEDEGN